LFIIVIINLQSWMLFIVIFICYCHCLRVFILTSLCCTAGSTEEEVVCKEEEVEAWDGGWDYSLHVFHPACTHLAAECRCGDAANGCEELPPQSQAFDEFCLLLLECYVEPSYCTVDFLGYGNQGWDAWDWEVPAQARHWWWLLPCIPSKQGPASLTLCCKSAGHSGLSEAGQKRARHYICETQLNLSPSLMQGL
jgi:hypothetical protein